MKLKTIVIDGATLNPGDLSWDGLREFGSYEIYLHSTRQEILQRCQEADAILTNKAPLDADMLAELPQLQYIGVTATGYNIVDVKAARERGILVTNVPTYGTASVAQMAFALLLELTQHVGHHSDTVREGRWTRSDNFCYWDTPLVELAGLTLGIVGCGRIGRAVARLGQAFGMTVIGHDVMPIEDPLITPVDLETLFAESDVISLHCPLTPENQGMINTARFSLMKQSAFLINTSRGQLVNEGDLAEALNNGRIAGAGLDVLSVEPPREGNPLLTAQNCIITPHIAWATRSARQRLLQTSLDNLAAWLNGRPQNLVNQ